MCLAMFVWLKGTSGEEIDDVTNTLPLQTRSIKLNRNRPLLSFSSSVDFCLVLLKGHEGKGLSFSFKCISHVLMVP